MLVYKRRRALRGWLGIGSSARLQLFIFFLKEEEGTQGLVGNRISVTWVDHQLDYNLDFLQRGGETKAEREGHLKHRIGTLSIA